ncbi:hypothetical protein SEEH4541_15236 [Salmonella enterica subsp. enterica serovar Heidelberg str. N4541]|nr:hypothetical protein SEEH4541_15236 [Salmonella enterica subsp. enterica serovar Heidelberg str. N4541]
MSGDIRQSNFMALRNMFSQFQAIRKTCSGFKTVVINNNCDIIGFMYFYIKTPMAIPGEFRYWPLFNILQPG